MSHLVSYFEYQSNQIYMRLNNGQLENFITRIKLKRDDMPKYRTQINNLREKLEEKIKNDKRTGLKVTR